MKIENINAPSLTPTAGTQSTPQMSARERAIQMLLKPTGGQDHPVPNPTQVSPEMLSAVKAPTASSNEDVRQKANNESATSDAPTETSSADTKTSEEPISSQYAVLARKEKAIRQREQQLRAREAQIKAAEDAAKSAPKSPTIDESKYVPKDRLTQDPFTVLNELGLNYDQLTELALNAPKPEQLALMNEIKAMREEILNLKGETKKSFEDQQNLQRTQAVSQISNEVKRLVNNDPNFETVKATGSISDVVELIEKTFDEDGILLSVEDAAQQVEDYLIEEAIKIARLSKIQQRLQPKESPAASAPQKTTTQPEQPQLKTLTNAITSSRPLSAKERAILAFQGKLSK